MTFPFFLPDLSAGFMGRLFIKPSLVHHDSIRNGLNITRCINYHCFQFFIAQWRSKMFLICTDWEYLFKMFSVSLGSNQNRVHDSYAGNTKKITCCLSIQFSNNIAITSWQIIGFPVIMEFLIYVAKITYWYFQKTRKGWEENDNCLQYGEI